MTERDIHGTKPRVLLVHNAYQLYGGEDAVVQAEEALLLGNGHAVLRYGRHNDDVKDRNPLRLAVDTVWSTRTVRDIGQLVRSFRPDVVHVHNTLPLISPAIYWAASGLQLPVVQTLHNFRLICPQAMLLRDGRICEDCVGHVPWRAVAHRCYRGSVAQSAAIAGSVQMHRALGTWRNHVSLYIALNEFCKSKFVEGGLPAERIRLKPNFIDLPAPQFAPRSGFLFVGRLSQEKGLHVLAQAVRIAGNSCQIRVAGTGPDRAQLEGLLGVELLGALTAAAIYAQMACATALVLPSIWYENFPRTLVEAYANGLPVIASRLGAMATLVDEGHTGLLFEPGNAKDLAEKLAWATANPHAMAQMGAAARQLYERDLTAETNYRCLNGIYAEAIASKSQQSAKPSV